MTTVVVKIAGDGIGPEVMAATETVILRELLRSNDAWGPPYCERGDFGLLSSTSTIS